MRHQKRTLRDYQQILIDAYYDNWMREILEPLYEAFQQWKQGILKHNDLTELIHKVHRENQKAHSFFTQSRSQIIVCIKMDNDWFLEWVKSNPPPTGVEL